MKFSITVKIKPLNKDARQQMSKDTRQQASIDVKEKSARLFFQKNIKAGFDNDILSGQWYAYNQLKSQVTNTKLLTKKKFLERKVGASIDAHPYLMV